MTVLPSEIAHHGGEDSCTDVDAKTSPGENTPVLTIGQVLVMSLPIDIVLVAGFPLLARWWSVDEDSLGWASVALLIGNLLLALGILRITRAPRPRLSKGAHTKPLQRALAITAENGAPPADPAHRAAAGAYACEIIESVPFRAAAIMGLVLTAFITGSSNWDVLAATLAVNAVLYMRNPRGSWRYLKALHAAPRRIRETGG